MFRSIDARIRLVKAYAAPFFRQQLFVLDADFGTADLVHACYIRASLEGEILWA